jgi:hypothetical protein
MKESGESAKPDEAKEGTEVTLPPYEVSNDIREHLLGFKNQNIFTKFEHEHSTQWKTEQLQLVKLFEFELEGRDPFYIEGQEQAIRQKKEQDKIRQKENVYSNFVSTESIDDFDDI